MSRQAYPAYKPSGIEWLGEIPEHWEARRMKTITRFGYGDSLAADDRTPGDFAVYGSNGVVGQHEKPNTRAPCLIVGRKGSFGKVAYSDKPCFAIDTTYFVDARLSQNDLRWLYYTLQWLRLDSFSKDSAVPGLAREDAYENFVAFCSLREQRAIAAFLDRETARIDALVAKKERQIELLQEKHAALISHAVTKGLDPNARMKDSGIEWLGDIPERWTVSRIATICSKITNGFVGPTRDILVPEGIPYLQSLHIKGNSIQFDGLYFVEEGWSKEHGKSILRQGDVLVVQTGDIGQVAVVPEEFEGANCHALIILSCRKEYALGKFLSLVLNSHYGFHSLKRIQTGALLPHLNCTFVREIYIHLPPLEEQKRIVTFLDRETARIDALAEQIEKSIDLLREYRTALISAAVTGKIDVREEAS